MKTSETRLMSYVEARAHFGNAVTVPAKGYAKRLTVKDVLKAIFK